MTDTPTPAPLVPSERALLPCPFCGADAEIEHSYREDDNRYPRDFWHVRVSCTACSVSPQGWVSYGEQEQRIFDAEIRQQAEAEAITAWNTRADRSNPGADLERLREAAETLVAALAKVSPIETRDTPDYAELNFGQHHTQAMTMVPSDWNDIANAYLDVREALATPTRAENAQVRGDDVEAVAKAIVEEIGWGTFSHLDPADVRRIARAAISALPPASTPDQFAENAKCSGMEEIVRQLLWQVEQVCGPLSTRTTVVAGDDDRSILEHNFRAILAKPQVPEGVEERALRKQVGAAISDPGATQGYKGERSLAEWQVDAVMPIILAALSAQSGGGR